MIKPVRTRLWLCLAATVLCPGLGIHQAAAQTSGSSTTASQREVSFDLGWRFYLGASPGAEATNFDDSSWRTLDVPHDWTIEDRPGVQPIDTAYTADPSNYAFVGNTIDPKAPKFVGPFDVANSAGQKQTGFTVGGEGWYRKHFTAQPSANKHVEVRFDGVFQNADIYLNGSHVGFHAYGYTSFTFDLTPYLSGSGDNVLAVHVNNVGQTARFYSGSGIIRHTYLVTTSTVRIPTFGVQITTPKVSASSATVHAVVAATNLPEPIQFGQNTAVKVTVLDAQGNAVATSTTAAQLINSGETKSFNTDLTVTNPALWSLESPTLYQAKVELMDGVANGMDSTTTSFGIRSIVFSPTEGFLLNGQRVIMKGACVHSDLGPLGTAALDGAEERRVKVLKASGFNAIRTAHNPPAPAMLDACDRLGMLVYDEAFDVWDVAKTADDYHLYFPQEHTQDLDSMVLRDYNHPSVIVWSVGNEIFARVNGVRQNYNLPLAQELVDEVHRLDTSRAVTISSFVGQANLFLQSQTVNDPRWTFCDIGDDHYQYDATVAHNAHPDKAIIQSESWPANIYENYQQALNNPYALGDFIWIGWDYLGETGAGAPRLGATGTPPPDGLGSATYPWFGDFQGDHDLTGQHKPQWYWRNVVYGNSPVEMAVERPVAPAGQQQVASLWSYYDELQSWTWNVPANQSMKVRVYSSGDSVTLLLNGQPVGTNTLTAADREVTTFSVPYQPGTLTAVSSKGGVEAGRKTFTTAGAPAALRLVSDTDSLTTDHNSLAFVRVQVLDAQGNLVPDAVVRVNVQVNNGNLAGIANGNPHNSDSFRQPNHYTWHGEVLAIAQSNGTPGTVAVTASAAGLTSATQTLNVTAPNIHPAFFTGEVPLSNGVYYLAFPNNGNIFGYYSYLATPGYIYHQDLGYEYVFDAQDGQSGVYLYDFKSNDFFYTSPSFPFPYLYDFGLGSVLYYYPSPNNPQRYNTDGMRYFYDFATGKIITK